jgi:hypothetical protein
MPRTARVPRQKHLTWNTLRRPQTTLQLINHLIYKRKLTSLLYANQLKILALKKIQLLRPLYRSQQYPRSILELDSVRLMIPAYTLSCQTFQYQIVNSAPQVVKMLKVFAQKQTVPVPGVLHSPHNLLPYRTVRLATATTAAK